MREEFEKAKKKYEDKFKLATPYLEMAKDLNPKKTEGDNKLYKTTLISLKQLYVRTNEMEKYKTIPNLIKELEIDNSFYIQLSGDIQLSVTLPSDYPSKKTSNLSTFCTYTK